MSQEWAIYIGAVYGAVQAIAQCVMLFLPSNTVAWRIAKFLVSGPARPAAPSTLDMSGMG